MKKLTQKQKEQLKIKIKNGFKKSLHILGYLSIVAWALLGILYACGSKQSKQAQDNTAQVKRDIQPRGRNNVYASYYYDIGDFQVRENYNSTSEIHVYESDVFSIYRDTSYNIVKSGNESEYDFYNLPGSAVMFSTFDNVKENYVNRTYFYLFVERGGTKPNPNLYCYELYRESDNSIVIRALNRSGDNVSMVTCLRWHRTKQFAYCSTSTHYSYVQYLFKGGNSENFWVSVDNANSFLPSIQKGADYFVRRFLYLFSDYSVNDLRINDIKTFDYDRVAGINGDFVPFDKYILGYNGGAYTSNIYVQNLYIGDFYLNGVYYNNINLTYDKVQDVTAFRYGYDSNDYVVVIGTKTLDSTLYSDYFYLSSMSLANTFNNTFINIAYYQHNQGNINNVGFYYNPEKNYDISDTLVIKSLAPVNISNSYVTFNTPSYYYLGSYFVLYQDTKYHYNVDGSINVSLTGDSQGSLYDVMTIINIGFTGITGLMGYMILPGISIGLLVSIPLTLTLLLFVIKMFKR